MVLDPGAPPSGMWEKFLTIFFVEIFVFFRVWYVFPEGHFFRKKSKILTNFEIFEKCPKIDEKWPKFHNFAHSFSRLFTLILHKSCTLFCHEIFRRNFRQIFQKFWKKWKFRKFSDLKITVFKRENERLSKNFLETNFLKNFFSRKIFGKNFLSTKFPCTSILVRNFPKFGGRFSRNFREISTLCDTQNFYKFRNFSEKCQILSGVFVR